MVNQYALAYANLLNDLIKQAGEEKPESTNFLAGIASAREHAIEAEKDRILKMNLFSQQKKIAEESNILKKQQMVDNNPIAKDLHKKLSEFGVMNGFTRPIIDTLSTPEGRKDFYEIQKIVRSNKNKNFIERLIDKYVYHYDPDKAKSETERVTKMIDYEIKLSENNPKRQAELRNIKRTWVNVATNLKNLSASEVKALGQRSQQAFNTFNSNSVETFIEAETPEDFINKSMTNFIKPIAEEIQLEGNTLADTEKQYGLNSTASKEFQQTQGDIYVYLPNASEGQRGVLYPNDNNENNKEDIGEEIQQDIQKGQKDGSVVEVFNSDKLEKNNVKENNDDLLKKYSPEGRQKVTDYAQKNNMTIEQVLRKFSK
jgi:hypothetical protein